MWLDVWKLVRKGRIFCKCGPVFQNSCKMYAPAHPLCVHASALHGVALFPCHGGELVQGLVKWMLPSDQQQETWREKTHCGHAILSQFFKRIFFLSRKLIKVPKIVYFIIYTIEGPFHGGATQCLEGMSRRGVFKRLKVCCRGRHGDPLWANLPQVIPIHWTGLFLFWNLTFILETTKVITSCSFEVHEHTCWIFLLHLAYRSSSSLSRQNLPAVVVQT